MELLDENGRLFGVINVIDAFVVLLTLALVVVGTTLVLSGTNETAVDTSGMDTNYATVSYSVPYGSDATVFGSNDTLAVIGSGRKFAVSDVYLSFLPNADVHVVAKIRYRGALEVNGNRHYGGDNIQLRSNSYRVGATVVSVNQSQPTIPIRSIPVVLALNTSTATAHSIEVGDEAAIGEQVVGTVESVDKEPSNGNSQLVWVGLTLRTWERPTGPVFDGEHLRVGNRVTVVTDRTVIKGVVHEIGTTSVENGSS